MSGNNAEQTEVSGDISDDVCKVKIWNTKFIEIDSDYPSSLSTKLAIPLKSKNEDFRRKTRNLEKDHLKDFKMMRNGIKNKIATIHKLRNKMKKQPSHSVQAQIEQNTRELHSQYGVLEEQQRRAVRKINVEERSQFCAFAVCVKDVMVGEVAVLEEMVGFGKDLENMNKIIYDPDDVPVTADEVINDIIAKETQDSLESSDIRQFWGSRCGSFRSLSSLVSSRSNSPLCISENNESKMHQNNLKQPSINVSIRHPIVEDFLY